MPTDPPRDAPPLIVCPICDGTGKAVFSEAAPRRFLEGLDYWARLREMTNEELAGAINETRNYLALRDLSPVVSQVLDEVWWRLHAANEPIEVTRSKIDALGENPEWLAK